MKNKIRLYYIFFLLMLCGLLLNTQGIAHAAASSDNTNEESSYIYIPAGSSCEGIVAQSVDYSTVITGQNVDIILLNDFKYKNKIIASSGSVIEGKITDKHTKNGKVFGLKIRFTSIRTLYNNIIPVNALVVLNGDADSKKLVANDKINLYFSQPITVGAK